MTQSDFVVQMNACRKSQGLPVLTAQEEIEDYTEFLREEEAAGRHRS